MDNNKNLNSNERHVSGIVHVLLSQDYAIYFLAVVLGVVFDGVFTFGKFEGAIYQNLGLIMLLLGSTLVYWAQKTTSTPKKDHDKERDTNFFIRGPYRYTRNPTNFGLTIMSLGLGLIIGSLFSIIFIIMTYFISKLFFIKKQDSILEERYGDVFREYKRKVKNWL